MRAILDKLRREIADLRARSVDAHDVDPATFDWYGESCPCGVPAGDCTTHKRARPDQRPPPGDWTIWCLLSGRASGKTHSGAAWVNELAKVGGRRIALVGATAADVRDVMVEGVTGILAVAPPWNRPRYEPSKRRLTWPSGSCATTFSADEPNRLRGPQFTHAWTDENAAWEYPAAWDMLLMGLRLGDKPRVLVTTTPKPTKVIKALVADSTAIVVKGSTFQNRAHLAPSYFDAILARYQGTRLGNQELNAEICEVSEAAWFARFDPTKHVTTEAEWDPRYGTILAIDAGTSMTTAAVFGQVRQVGPYHWRVNIFDEYCREGSYSAENASAIFRKSKELPCQGVLEAVWIDPAASARSGLGPAAIGEYERLWGRLLNRSPHHHVVDSLDQIETLLDQGCFLIHPRCTGLRQAFFDYRRQQRGGEYLNKPLDFQSPAEDLIDACRYFVRGRFPGGREADKHLKTVHATRMI